MLDDTTAQNTPGQAEFDGRPLSEVIQTVERQYICAVLNVADGNKTKAADPAGLTYNTFVRKLNGLNLTVTYHAG